MATSRKQVYDIGVYLSKNNIDLLKWLQSLAFWHLAGGNDAEKTREFVISQFKALMEAGHYPRNHKIRLRSGVA